MSLRLIVRQTIDLFLFVNNKAKMAKCYCFPNTFADYTEENAKDLIDNNSVNPKCKISCRLNEKWQSVSNQFQYLDPSDYSVYTGTAGVALLLLRKDPNDKVNLDENIKQQRLRGSNSRLRTEVERSSLLSRDMVNLETGMKLSTEIIKKRYVSIYYLKNKRCTFLCGDAGPLAIGIVVNYKLGLKGDMEKLIKRLYSLHSDVINVHCDLPNEYMYGRAGYLYAILYVNKHVSPPPYEDSFIRLIIEAILVSGRNLSRTLRLQKCPLMFEWHDSKYLGAAHGVSGIMYLLLQAKEYLTEEDLNTLVKPTIDYLATLRFPTGNFPSSLGVDKPDKYVQWCHGAPGFLYMFCEAHKVFGDARYLELALSCGDVVWQRGLLRKGYSLCHGVSGNAYCFLELFQTTKDPKHLYRAIKFAEYCMDYTQTREEHSPDRPLSLYEGTAGPMYLLLDMQKPLDAKFPGFTL